jgi:hypothetical protein
MSDEAQAEPVTLAEPTEARFSMRSLFIAMAIVELLSAVLGPLVRGLKPHEQTRLLATWAIWLAATFSWIAFQARRRFQAERLAGATLARLPMFDEKVGSAVRARWWFNVVAGACLALWMFSIMSSQAIFTLAAGLNLSGIALWGAVAMWFAARIATSAWWRNNIRFCEGGVLWDTHVVKWDYIIQHRWNDSKKNVLELKGIDQSNREVAWKIPVPDERRDEIQSLFSERMTKGDSAASGHSILELGRIPISTAVKNPNFPRYLAGLVLRVPAVIALFIVVANGPADIREFDGAIFPGIVVAIVLATVSWRWIGKQAGPPLVRLSGHRGWLGFWVYAAAATILYFAATYLSGTSAVLTSWPFYAIGLAFGWAVANAFRYLYPRHIDLRASGVSLPGELFWPWEKLRMVRWDYEGNGKLVLARGWQRLCAKVPQEQREAVNVALSERLANQTTSRLPSRDIVQPTSNGSPE